MTVPDSRPIRDVIADVQRTHYAMGVVDGWRVECSCGHVIGRTDSPDVEDRHARHVSAAVVAACRGATVEQQAELTGVAVERSQWWWTNVPPLPAQRADEPCIQRSPGGGLTCCRKGTHTAHVFEGAHARDRKDDTDEGIE